MEEESSDGAGLEAEISEVTRVRLKRRDEIAGAGTKDEPEEMDIGALPCELSDGMGEGAAATGEASTEEPEEISIGALPCELSEGASLRTGRLDELSGKIALELKFILIDILVTMPQ